MLHTPRPITIPLIIMQQDLTQAIINSPTHDPVALAGRRVGLINPVSSTRTLRWQSCAPSAENPQPQELISAYPLELVRFLRDLEYQDRFNLVHLTGEHTGKPWLTPVKGKKGETLFYAVSFQLPAGTPLR